MKLVVLAMCGLLMFVTVAEAQLNHQELLDGYKSRTAAMQGAGNLASSAMSVISKYVAEWQGDSAVDAIVATSQDKITTQRGMLVRVFFYKRRSNFPEVTLNHVSVAFGASVNEIAASEPSDLWVLPQDFDYTVESYVRWYSRDPQGKLVVGQNELLTGYRVKVMTIAKNAIQSEILGVPPGEPAVKVTVNGRGDYVVELPGLAICDVDSNVIKSVLPASRLIYTETPERSPLVISPAASSAVGAPSKVRIFSDGHPAPPSCAVQMYRLPTTTLRLR